MSLTGKQAPSSKHVFAFSILENAVEGINRPIANVQKHGVFLLRLIASMQKCGAFLLHPITSMQKREAFLLRLIASLQKHEVFLLHSTARVQKREVFLLCPIACMKKAGSFLLQVFPCCRIMFLMLTDPMVERFQGVFSIFVCLLKTAQVYKRKWPGHFLGERKNIDKLKPR